MQKVESIFDKPGKVYAYNPAFDAVAMHQAVENNGEYIC